MITLIGMMRKNTEYEQAKHTMKQIEEAINSLEENKVETILVESPKDWYLMNFKIEQDSDKIPSNCGGKECLCLCNESTTESCEKAGVCKSFNDGRMLFDNVNFLRIENDWKSRTISSLASQIIPLLGITNMIFGDVWKPRIALLRDFIEISKVPIKIIIQRQGENIIFSPIYLDSSKLSNILEKETIFEGKTKTIENIVYEYTLRISLKDSDKKLKEDLKLKLDEELKLFLGDFIRKEKLEGASIYISIFLGDIGKIKEDPSLLSQIISSGLGGKENSEYISYSDLYKISIKKDPEINGKGFNPLKNEDNLVEQINMGSLNSIDTEGINQVYIRLYKTR
jgi:hypothetical protein